MRNRKQTFQSIAHFFLITISLTKSSENSVLSNAQNNPEISDSSKTVSIDNTQKTIIDDLEERHIKEDREHHRIDSEEDDAYTVIDDVTEDSDEKAEPSWLEKNKGKVINALLVMVGFALFALIGYKLYSLQMSIKEKNREIEGYANQLERIIEGTDKLVFMTWKDQKEGIQFIENPAYKKKSDVELTKVQQIQAEIEKVEDDINKKSKEIDSLREKELYYINEIEKLENELEDGKALALDEGAALGFADTVVREFK